MSTTVDSRVVEMRFDNKQFEANVQTSLKTLNDLKKGLDLSDSAKGLEAISKASSKVSFDGLTSGIETVQTKFSALGAFTFSIFQNIGNEAWNAGKKIMSNMTQGIRDGFSEYETQINAVQTILANTESKGTTLDDVNGALDELNAYADKTIYNFTEMTRNIGTFTAAGVDLDTSVAAIKGIANLAAVSGSTSQQASTAMYQLSQALSSGTVKLMDWNSVVNAGMGGQVFQDALKETARVHGIAIDQMIEDEGSFRDTLKNEWLSSDVLLETLNKFTGDLSREQLVSMGYTEEQIAGIVKMGQTANDAATKVKTFTQLFDTLKEATQSGWTQTWEIIVGDFEEAKELLTEISNIFGAIINESAQARNELLKGWKDLGGRTALIESFHNVLEGVGNIIKPIKEAFREIFPPATSEQLYNITAAFKNLTDKFKQSTTDTSDLKSTFKGLFAILDIGKQIIEAVFTAFKPIPKETANFGGELLKVTGAIGDWIVKLSETTRETGVFKTALLALTAPFKNLGKLIKDIGNSDEMKGFIDALSAALKQFGDGLITSFEKGIEIVKKFGDTVKERFGLVKNNVGGVGESVKNLGKKFLTALTGIILSSGEFATNVKETFGAAIKVISDFGSSVVSTIGNSITRFGEFITSAKENIEFPGLKTFSDFLDGLKEKMNNTKQTVGDMKNGIVTSVQEMGEAVANSRIVQFFKELWDGIKMVASGIGKLFGGIASGLGETFTGDNFLETIGGLSIGAIAVSIVQLVKSMKDMFKELGSVTDNFVGILDSIKGCFEAYQNSLNAEALMKIATAIGILAAAIVVLALVDVDKLNGSIIAISTLFAELMLTMKIMGSGSMNMAAMSASCIALSTAIAIMGTTLAGLAQLDSGGLTNGILAIAGLSAIVTASAKIMSSGTDKIASGTAGLILFAAAIKVLASACKDLSELDVAGLIKGLTGVGVLIAEITAFLKLAKFNKNVTKTATGILVLSAALKVLADVCEDFAGMSISGMIQGLTGVGLLLAEVAGFTRLVGSPDRLVSTATAITILGAAMKIFASVVEDLGSMDWKDMVAGLGGMAGALASIVVAVNLMPKDMMAKSAAMVVMATAITGLSLALQIIGSMSWTEMGTALITMGGALGMLAIGLNAMNGSLGGSAALLVAASAMLVMAPALKLLGNLSLSEIGVGLIALAGAFAVLGVAAAVLSPVIPAMLGLAGAFALVGAGALGIGAGLLAAAAGLTALAAGFTAIAALGATGAVAVVQALETIIVGVANTIVVIGQKLGEAVVAFGQAIIDGAPVICEAVITVVQSVVTAVMESVPLIVEGVMSIITSTISVINDYTPDICDGVLNILTTIIESIANALPDILTAVFDILMTVLKTIAEYTPKIIEAVLDIVVGFLEAIAEKLPDVISAAVDVALAFIKGITEKLPDIIQAGFELLIAFLQGITNAINENTPMLVETMKDLFLALLGAALEILKGGIELVWEAGKKIIDSGLIQGIWSKLKAFTAKVGELIVAGVTAIKNKLSEWLQAGKDLVIKIIAGIAEKIGAYREKVNEMVNSGMTAIKNKLGEWLQAGKDLIQKIIDGIASMFTNIASTAGSLIDNAKSAITGKFTEWKNIGKDLIGGFISGIKDKASDLFSAATSVVSDAVDGVKDFLGIHSPSRLFAEIGRYSDEGLIEGLKAYSGRVSDTATDVGANMVDAMSNSIDGINSIIDDDDWEPMIRPVIDLSNIEAGTRSIEAMFSRTQAMSLSAQMRASSSRNSEFTDAEGSTHGASYQFVQNNYSPKALSRIDIYRQTKNQFSALERMATS